jgi:hypothetical protein
MLSIIASTAEPRSDRTLRSSVNGVLRRRCAKTAKQLSEPKVLGLLSFPSRSRALRPPLRQQSSRDSNFICDDTSNTRHWQRDP